MKKSKKTPEREQGVDMNRISNMPDHVLQSILSRITSSKEVVRTSILSRRWRYLWTSVPSLDIDCTRGLLGLESSRFIWFVYWALVQTPQDLESFGLWCSSCYNISTISLWIHAAVRRKVKLVDLMVCIREESDAFQVLYGLMTCGSLEELRLCFLGWPLYLPDITGFQALRVLELKEIYFFDDDDVVNYLLESCPFLEELSLIDCEARKLVISCSKLKILKIVIRKKELFLPSRVCLWLEISCPKLEFLELTGSVADEIIFESLYSLKEAVIHAVGMFGMPFDLFSKISHVESLSISTCCLRRCFHPKVDAPISLPHLKTLELTIDGSSFNRHSLIPFLRCLPDLESFHLIIAKVVDVGKWNLNEAATISVLTRYLKKVEFLEFDYYQPKLDLARDLLEHENLLEEMIFSWGYEAKFHERSMETMNQVSKFDKASSSVKLTCVTTQAKPTRVFEIDSIQIKTSSRG